MNTTKDSGVPSDMSHSTCSFCNNALLASISHPFHMKSECSMIWWSANPPSGVITLKNRMTETLLASCSELQTEISKTSTGNWLLWSLSHFAKHYYITPKDDIDRAILSHQHCWQRCVTSFYRFIVINGEDVFSIQIADALHKACKILLVSLIPQFLKVWKACQRFANSVFVMVAFHAQVDVCVLSANYVVLYNRNMVSRWANSLSVSSSGTKGKRPHFGDNYILACSQQIHNPEGSQEKLTSAYQSHLEDPWKHRSGILLFRKDSCHKLRQICSAQPALNECYRLEECTNVADPQDLRCTQWPHGTTHSMHSPVHIWQHSLKGDLP